MVDDATGSTDVDKLEQAEEGSRGRLSRLAFAVVLLLLLALCIIMTLMDVWSSMPAASVQNAILSNMQCLYCHTELLPQFSRKDVHNPFLKKKCTSCHTKHGDLVRSTKRTGLASSWERLRNLIEWLPLRAVFEIADVPARFLGNALPKSSETSETQLANKRSTLVLPEQDLCWMCHGRRTSPRNLAPKRQMAFQHNPFQHDRCTICHDPHASNYISLTNQDMPDLCFTCHPIQAQIDRVQPHPPAQQGQCLSCHDPHASPYEAQLIEKQPDLCFMCHPKIAPLSLMPVVHPPFLDKCTGCHEPHGADFMPLLHKPVPPLCYDCHVEIRYDFLKISHHPVGTVRLNCPDCHSPHAAEIEFLLVAKDNDLCFECHTNKNGNADAIKPTYVKSKHGTEGVLCIKCHTPHGSDEVPLLRLPNPEVCLQCHKNWTTGNVHPSRPNRWDPAANKPLTCTSTCHNPHGTVQNYMLRHYSFPFDGVCLQCHAIVPGKVVGKDF